MSRTSRTAPEGQLVLEWVYGYKGHHCRNNVFYTGDGEIVYFVAGVGIVQDAKKKIQRFFLGHNDDIMSLTIHPEGKLIATGQIGKDPRVCVWNAKTTETVSILQNGHERGISVLAFSNTGELLLSVGEDNHHVFNVWKWKTGKIVASARGHSDKVLDAKFSANSENSFVSCGVKHIKFWKFCGNSLSFKKGIFGRLADVQTMLCLAFGADDTVYSGTAKGDIFVWQGVDLRKVIKGHHQKAVNSIHAYGGEGFASGSSDGSVCLWDSNFSFVTKIDLAVAPSGYPELQIRSVCWKGEKMLAGTRDSEIFEISIDSKNTPVCITQGHGEGELWALATHSDEKVFATGSDDKTIRIWNAEEKSLIIRCSVPHAVRSLAFSPDGAHLAAGFQSGSFVVLNAGDFSEVVHIKDRKEVLHELKYSPNGLFLAVGSNDNFVDVYSTRSGYKRVGTCRGASSFITHLDWSSDSQYLQINSGASERLYYHMPDGRRIPSSAETERIEWSTWTGVLGDEVAGMWPKYSQVNDVNATMASFQHSTMVTGDDFGLVKLFQFPCPAKGSKFKKYVGHSAHVTNVRFLSHDSHVISVGGADQSIFQWQFLPPDKLQGDTEASTKTTLLMSSAWAASDTDDSNSDASDVQSLDSDLEREEENMYQRKIYKEDIPKIKKEAESEKKSNCKGSTKKLSAPDNSLNLEFVHGYRGYDCRNNLYYLANGDIIYHVAALGIVYNIATHQQRFYSRHSDDILCLTMHPSEDILATGQIGRSPPIHIWNGDSMECLSVLKGEHERGVCAVDFSGDGKKLVSIGLDDNHSIVVWNWRKGEKLATTRGHKDKIFMASWNPLSSDQIVTVGVKHIKFWNQVGGGFTSKRGVFGAKGKACSMLCVVFGKADGHCHTGGLDGLVYHWTGNNLQSTTAAHKGPLYVMRAVEKGFVTGGKDGQVCIWDDKFKGCLKRYDIHSSSLVEGRLSADCPPVRALCLGHGKVLVGTRNSEVLLVEQSGAMRLLAQGHREGEVWGLGMHPSQDICATASDDATLRIWNIQDHKMAAFKELDKPARCVGYSSDGSHLAVGFKDGSFVVLDAATLKVVASFQHRKQEVSDVKFSPGSQATPGGKYLAVASHENFVDIYNVFSQKRVGICKGASSYITHIDWDISGRLLRINTGDSEVLYFEAPRGKQQMISHKDAEEIQWATNTGVLGPDRLGIWPPYTDVTDVNAAMVSHDGHVIATGDDFGYVKLFQFPSKTKHAKCKQYSGHSAHVTNVRWSSSDHKLISIGGADTSVMVWSYSGQQHQVVKPYLMQGTVTSDDSESDSEDEEGYDSDVEREKTMDYVEKTYTNPAHDALSNGIHQQPQQEAKTPSKPVVSRVTTETPKVAQAESKRGSIQALELHFVFGYRGSDSRQNLTYTPSGELLYSAAGTGIVYNTTTRTQAFYLEHNDDIIALSLNRHPKFSNIVATGQIGSSGPVHVWNYVTKETVSILHGVHSEGVCSTDFSPNGKFLLTVGLGPDHLASVWRWKEGSKVASAIGSQQRIFLGKFYPDSDSNFVTVGVKHVKFWRVVGGELVCKRGKIQNTESVKHQTMMSLAFGSNGITFTGSVSGDVYEWKGFTLSRVISRAHSGPVFAMYTCPEDGAIVTGGKEKICGEGGMVKVWDNSMSRSREFPLAGPQRIVVRSLFRSKGRILIGSQDNAVLELLENGGRIHCVIQGHGEGELCCLATNPLHPSLFLTGSQDKTIRLWDLENKMLSSQLLLNHIATAADVSPDGRFAIVGLACGEFILLNLSNGKIEVVDKKRDRRKWIRSVRFSPKGDLLAVGSDEPSLDFYLMSPSASKIDRRLGSARGISSGMTAIDWSTDGQFVQVDTKEHMKEVFHVSSGGLIEDPTSTSSITWTSWTSVLGPEVLGMWPVGSSKFKVDINTVHVPHCGGALVAGDDLGSVNLFKSFPLKDCPASSIKYFGHSAVITCVRFTSDDEYLLSTGGEDSCIFVWKTVDDNFP